MIAVQRPTSPIGLPTSQDDPAYWDQFSQPPPPTAAQWSATPGGANSGTGTYTPPPAAAAPASGKGDPEGFQKAWFASGGKTVDDLKAFVAAHPEFGATITGSKGSKLTFPGGQAFQAVRSAGLGGGIGPAWDDLSGGGGSGAGGTNLGDFGSFAQGFNKEFTPPTTIAELEATPGYQFTRDQGLKAIDTGAAAHGTLLTMGNQKDRADYASGLASQRFDTTHAQALQDYQNAYNVFRTDKNDIWGRYNDVSSRGLTAANDATS